MVGSAECSYCNCLISDDFVVFGGDVLHRRCYEQISEDLDEGVTPVTAEAVEPIFVFLDEQEIQF